MIKARLGNLIILGIDAENVRRLQDNLPIMVQGSDLGMKENVMIVYGKTLDEIIGKMNLPRVN